MAVPLKLGIARLQLCIYFSINVHFLLVLHVICRCGIPVVIMGETGCGKTRLIRFMCNLASQGSSQRNMLILKVTIMLFVS